MQEENKNRSVFEYIPIRIPSPEKRRRFKLPSKLHNYLFNELTTKPTHHEEHHWFKVMWLSGVDYFSTLGYQPGIALMFAASLAPIATILLIIVTLFGAVPTYFEVSKRSFTGQGSIAMLENLLKGWFGKFFVLTLLGFGATDFIITITLSAADAATHIIENPHFSLLLGHSRMSITLGMLCLLAWVFLKGFSEAIGTAIFVAIPYIILNIIVLSVGLHEVYLHPEYLHNWRNALTMDYNISHILVFSALIFPKLALGLSGFETGVSVMPLIKNSTYSGKNQLPVERIKGTRKLLITSGLLMSVLLLASSFATTLLIDTKLVQAGGEANGRAISYIATKYLGSIFGTVYDLSTIIILWFAGASALAGLLNLIPRYLPRFGMAPSWVAQRRPLVLVLLAICIIVTLIFHADVDSQSAAYATGVLVLILSASIAVALALKKEHIAQKKKGLCLGSFYYWGVSAVFAYTLIDNIIERPDGIIISAVFITGVCIISAISRWLRQYEIRVSTHTFINAESKKLWEDICNKQVNLVPISTPDETWRKRREAMIRNYYRVNGPLAFLAIQPRDDRSEFMAPLKISVKKIERNHTSHYAQEEDQKHKTDYLINVSGAVAIANTIAYISEQIDPIGLYLGLARKNAMEQAVSYLLFGEGEIGIITYKVLVQHWESTPEDDVRPVIFLMSE